jgi:hypothetical protein
MEGMSFGARSCKRVWNVPILNAHADMPLFRLFRAGMYDVLLLTGEE